MKYNIKEPRKTHKKHWTKNPYLQLGTLIILIFSARAAYGVYKNKNESERAAYNKQNELAQLEERQTFLTSELKKFSTTDGKESELREKFGVAKPGENVAIIVQADDNASSTESSDFFGTIKSFFSNIFK